MKGSTRAGQLQSLRQDRHEDAHRNECEDQYRGCPVGVGRDEAEPALGIAQRDLGYDAAPALAPGGPEQEADPKAGHDGLDVQNDRLGAFEQRGRHRNRGKCLIEIRQHDGGYHHGQAERGDERPDCPDRAVSMIKGNGEDDSEDEVLRNHRMDRNRQDGVSVIFSPRPRGAAVFMLAPGIL